MALTCSERKAVFDLLELSSQVDQKTSLARRVWHVATIKLLVDSLLEKILLLRVTCHFHHLWKQSRQQS